MPANNNETEAQNHEPIRENGHEFVTFAAVGLKSKFGLVCKACGIVRNADRSDLGNKPCKGRVAVRQRN